MFIKSLLNKLAHRETGAQSSISETSPTEQKITEIREMYFDVDNLDLDNSPKLGRAGRYRNAFMGAATKPFRKLFWREYEVVNITSITDVTNKHYQMIESEFRPSVLQRIQSKLAAFLNR